ncbi:hypothetical protein [Paenibacillus pinistramenti]|uniref:hypothetical protein n=1 Tax=Paenibacillus pinistramenti TaxID=1768003 RepID=UPI0011091D81|nr:hypothetical protein [Paenibacillus pinistramenti]
MEPSILNAMIYILLSRKADEAALRRMLEGFGYANVLCLPDMPAVHQLLLLDEADLIITDAEPAEEAPGGLIKLLQKRHGATAPRCLLVPDESADYSAEDERFTLSLEPGSVNYISRPFEEAGIRYCVRYLLEYRQLQKLQPQPWGWPADSGLHRPAQDCTSL